MTMGVIAANVLGLTGALWLIVGNSGANGATIASALVALCAALAGAFVIGRVRATPSRRHTDSDRLASSELVQANARLSAALAAAETAGLAKREFMSNMSHELRTPMTAILGYADLLTTPGLSPAEQTEFVQNIRRSGRHLLTIINDILDISRVESGHLLVDLEPTSPMQLFEEVLSLVRPAALAKSLQLASVVEVPIPEKIRTDAARVRQILLNLAGNAIKFTEQGTVMLRMDFVPGDQPMVRYHVCDTGPGMEPARLAALGDLFAQGDTSFSRRHGGLGVGLALAHRLATLVGATLEARSQPGVGTTFTLTVPTGPLEGVPLRDRIRSGDNKMVEAPGKSDPSQAAPAPPLPPNALSGRRILFVEDGPDNRRLVCFHLKQAGASVETAENGRIGHDAALAAYTAQRPFDLVFMDMQMPEMDGYAATSLLRSEGYRAPIVALTAHAMSGDREKCIAAGCDDYITKPIDRDILIGTALKWTIGPPGISTATTGAEHATAHSA